MNNTNNHDKPLPSYVGTHGTMNAVSYAENQHLSCGDQYDNLHQLHHLQNQNHTMQGPNDLALARQSSPNDAKSPNRQSNSGYENMPPHRTSGLAISSGPRDQQRLQDSEDMFQSQGSQNIGMKRSMYTAFLISGMVGTDSRNRG